MKKILIFLFVSVFQISFAQNWHLDFEEAKKQSDEQNKAILLVFSGSDWCTPCIKLDKNIWQSEVFKNEASSNWILVKADFPRKKANELSKEQKAHNAKLAEKYNKEGSFPLVILLDKNGKILGKMGFKNMAPEEYIKTIHSLEKK